MASPLGKLFGKSPVAPIQQHMQLAEESVQLLCELYAASTDGDTKRVAEIFDVIGSTAREARELRREIRLALPRGLLLAMPRPDLLELLELQECVVDRVQATAKPVALRGNPFTPSLQKQLDRLCSVIAAAAGQVLAAIRELDEILEQGFGGRERKAVLRSLAALDRQVARCDREQQKLFKQVGKQEKSMDAVDVMFLYQNCANLEALAKACGDVGEQLRLLLA